MPVYVYEIESRPGQYVDLYMSYEERKRREHDGRIALWRYDEISDTYRVEWARFDMGETHRGFIDTPGTYPKESYALGSDPESIPEEMAEDRRLGIRYTEYSAEGCPIFRDKAHEREYVEKRGYYFRNAGYGDPTPKEKKHVQYKKIDRAERRRRIAERLRARFAESIERRDRQSAA